MPRLSDAGGLSRLRPETLRDRAYDEVRAAILRGRLAPGSSLSEQDVAAALGVSRTPVREALGRLRRDGLVAEVAGVNVVRTISGAEARELFLIREAIECLAVRELGSIAVDAAAIATIEHHLDDQRRHASAGDHDAFLDADEAFHVELCRQARLPMVAEMLASLRAQIRLAGLMTIEIEGRTAAVLREHTAVLTALKSRDTHKAEAAIRRHLTATQQAVQTVSSSRREGA
jgi:DNA-binding GntR family transcriptional regulator